ncbi:MAG: LysR family transcriptional regulator [Lachnospiraceae bacterium]|nr:LysR family transcriptional regulator [Lachnospiraceae bacterium]
MTITQLDTFIKITETKNFTGAANLLGYAQSTVTTQIKQLEDELNCLLFERLGKSVILTPEGERLLVYAEKMLQLEREIMLEVPTVEEPSGILRLGVSESLCYNRLPHFLLEYKKKYPKMEIELQFITHDTFPMMLKKGILDMVYTLNPYIELPELALLYKNRETLGFYASPNYPLADKKKIKEKDLKDIPLLLTSHNCSFRQMLVDDMVKSSITPQIVLETSSKEILKQFAINELGVAFMPDMTAQEEVKANRLKKLDWKGNDFPIYSQIFIHKDKRINKAINELVKIISG